MAETFDPYHRWLGIPPKDQPPHAYRLLGLDAFEADPQVIRDAAERQMAHVRTYQLGPRSELSQKILNELAAAKACLSEPAKKAEYDRRLRASLAPAPPTGPPPPLRGPTGRRNLSLAAGFGGLAIAVIGAAVWIAWPRESPEPVAEQVVAESEPEPDRTPQLAPMPDLTVPEGQPIRLVVTTVDRPSGPTKLRYELGKDAPAGARIDPQSGEFTWTPAETQGPGRYAIPVVATSGEDAASSGRAVLHVEVREVNDPPRLRPVKDCAAECGKLLRVELSAEDSDRPANKLAFALIDGPPGATVEAASGTSCTFRWQPRSEDAGQRHQATVEVTDNGVPPRSDRKLLTISVASVPGPRPAEASPMVSPGGVPAPPAGGHKPPGLEQPPTAPVSDMRLAELQRIFENVLPLFRSWAVASAEQKDLMVQLQPVVTQAVQLGGQLQQLQARARTLEIARRGAHATNDQAAAADYSRQIADCQTQAAAIQGPLQAALAEKGRLENLIGEKRRQQALAVKDAERVTESWVGLCDPFGRLPKAAQQRLVDRAGQWMGQEGQLWLPYMARAFAYINLGQYELAMGDIERLRQLNSAMNGFAAASRGHIFTKQGDLKKAMAEFGKAASLDPKLGILYVFRGHAYLVQERYSDAEKEFRRAVQVAGKAPEAHNALALLLAASPHPSVRNGKQAVEHATKACEASGWRIWVYADTLAAAYAESGDFQAAIKYENQAIGLAPAEVHDGLRQRLSLYQDGKPYRMK